MARIIRYLAIVTLLLGVMGIALGGVFISQGIAKANLLKEEMQLEQVTYLLPEEEVAKGNVIDTAEEAEQVADTVREHRHNIAPTYEDLLAGGRYDATNATHLAYAQAMNMENYLYLAVMGFGLTDVVLASGVFMVVVGIGLSGTGIAVFVLTRRRY